jgi:hypothetical protein
MADDFDFVDDLEEEEEERPVSSPGRSMKKKESSNDHALPKENSSNNSNDDDLDGDDDDEKEEKVIGDVVPRAAGGSSVASIPAPVRTFCPVLKGSRHKRDQLRKQQEEQRRQQKLVEIKQRQENNGCSPDRHVHFSTEQKKNKSEKEENDDDDEEWNSSSVSSSSAAVLSARASVNIPARRKRRRKQTAVNNNNNRPKAKLARHVGTATNNNKNRTMNGSPDMMSPPLPSDMMKRGGQLSLSEQIKKQLQQHEKAQQKICPSPTREIVARSRVRGAVRDVYAVQDAGNHQMIHDECTYIASTILACPRVKIPSKASIIESVAELASLLASTKARRTLWQGEAGSSQQHQKALEDILDVIEHTTRALIEKSSLHCTERWKGLTQRLSLVTPKEVRGHEMAVEIGNAKPTIQPNIVETYFTGLLLDALSAIVSFLSWDATVQNQISVNHKNASGARSLRQTMLHHDGVLSAMLYVVRQSDPIVSSILEQSSKVNTESASTLASKGQSSEETELSTRGARRNEGKKDMNSTGLSQSQDSSSVKSEGRSAFSSSQADAESIMSTQATEDPTIAGRRKRRRRNKCVNLQLETIAEDGSISCEASGAMSPQRVPPRVVFEQPHDAIGDARSKLSFQDSPSRQSSSPQRGRDRDDGSSMVSCDSTLLTIHDQLGKARDKFAVQDRALRQANKEQHDCQGHRELHLSFGGKDPAGCSSFMALKALRRLLIGKDEGDQQSCLEEDDNSQNNPVSQADNFGLSHEDENDRTMADSPNPHVLEEDELLLNNPLMQTNRILGDSGALASLAEGMAEILTCIVEEVEHVTSNKACLACLQHLHDKLVGLAPIVENACLLHENNRIELCSASTGSTALDDARCDCGVLVTSQVLFLKLWLQQRAPVNGKKTLKGTMTLLNEVGMSVLSTLTSLSHDNSLAADQLVVRYRDVGCSNVSLSEQHTWSGVDLLGQIIFRTATTSTESSGRVAYDSRIFW